MSKLKIVVDAVWKGKGKLNQVGKDFKHMREESRKANDGIRFLGNELKNLGAGFIAAGVFAKKAFDFAQEGANLNQLTDSFNLMNQEVFKVPGLLDKMTAAVDGTIKSTDLMAGLMTLTAGTSKEMSQKFAEAAPRLLEIARASNKLNPKLGTTSFLYQSLATGIKRSSPLILDNLGLTIKIGDANERWAKANNTTVDSMTAEQKQMALLAAATEAGDTLINQVGGSVDSQADAWQQLSVMTGNAIDKTKQYMATRLTPVLQSGANAVKQVSDAMDILNRGIAAGIIKQEDWNQAATFAGGTTTDWKDSVVEARIALDKLSDITGQYARQDAKLFQTGQNAMASSLDDTIRSNAGFVTGLREAGGASGFLRREIEPLTDAMDELISVTQVYQDLLDRRDKQEQYADTVHKLGGDADFAAARIENLGQKLLGLPPITDIKVKVGIDDSRLAQLAGMLGSRGAAAAILPEIGNGAIAHTTPSHGGVQGPGFAQGGSFLVPPGFPGDTFPLRVSSGERVTVEKRQQQHNGGVNINIGSIVQQPGEDGERLAERVSVMIARRLRQFETAGVGALA